MGLFQNWSQQTLGAATGGYYGAGFRNVLGLLERALLFRDLIQIVFAVMLWVAVISAVKVLKSQGKADGQDRGPLLILLALMSFGGLIQGALGYEFFRIQNSCFSIYFVSAAFIEGHFNGTRYRKFTPELKFLFGMVMLSMLFRYPHGSNLWPVYEGRLRDYEESTVPYLKGHRTQMGFES